MALQVKKVARAGNYSFQPAAKFPKNGFFSSKFCISEQKFSNKKIFQQFSNNKNLGEEATPLSLSS